MDISIKKYNAIRLGDISMESSTESLSQLIKKGKKILKDPELSKYLNDIKLKRMGIIPDYVR